MRAYLPAYDLQTPANLAEALRLFADAPNVWKPFAGGTDLMVLLEAGKLAHQRFISLWHLPELRGITVTDDHVMLGAMTTYTQIQTHPVLQTEFPLLCQAASWTGSVAIQNRGTLGGNIANASPAADSLPALLVYEAAQVLLQVAKQAGYGGGGQVQRAGCSGTTHAKGSTGVAEVDDGGYAVQPRAELCWIGHRVDVARDLPDPQTHRPQAEPGIAG